MSEQGEPAPSRTCPECGREPDLGVDEPVTHCEWCGAEYPVPGQDVAPVEERQADPDAAERQDA